MLHRNVRLDHARAAFHARCVGASARAPMHGECAARQRGAAMAETIVALLALTPFIAGVPLLGKQLDVKHKSFDAARYSVWERTVWRSDGASNRKSDADITLEMRDRTLGDPRAGLLATDALRARGITENPLWRDRQRERLLDYDDNGAPISRTHDERPTPVDVGYFLVPGVAYGDGPISAVAAALQVDDLNLNRNAFATTSVSVGLRPVLSRATDQPPTLAVRNAAQGQHGQLVQRAAGAVLSDTWSANDENHLRRRVDDLTTNELIEDLERPGRPIGMQAVGRGQPLYGEGQYGWDPDLRPSSNTLPAAYITPR
jgi:hypothetical protein